MRVLKGDEHVPELLLRRGFTLLIRSAQSRGGRGRLPRRRRRAFKENPRVGHVVATDEKIGILRHVRRLGDERLEAELEDVPGHLVVLIVAPLQQCRGDEGLPAFSRRFAHAHESLSCLIPALHPPHASHVLDGYEQRRVVHGRMRVFEVFRAVRIRSSRVSRALIFVLAEHGIVNRRRRRGVAPSLDEVGGGEVHQQAIRQRVPRPLQHSLRLLVVDALLPRGKLKPDVWEIPQGHECLVVGERHPRHQLRMRHLASLCVWR